MLKFRNGKFHALGVTFVVPEEFWLETEPESGCEYGIGAWTPDKQSYVEWKMTPEGKEIKEEMAELFADGTGLHPLAEIQPVQINGLDGYQALYAELDEQIMEVRLLTSRKTEIDVLVRSRGNDIAKVMETPEIKAVLEGIREEA